MAATIPEEDLLRMSLSSTIPPSPTFTATKNLGNAAFKAGRYNDALAHYTEAESINPLSPIPPANRAMVHLKMQNYQEARADASIALELHAALIDAPENDPLPIKVLLRRAVACNNLLLFGAAAHDYTKVLELDPRNQDAKKGLKELEIKHGVKPKSKSVMVQVLGETNGKAAASAASKRHVKPHTTIIDESPLLQLDKMKLKQLGQRWSATTPRNWPQFERAWKSLNNDHVERASYLIHVVGPDALKRGVLGEALTPQLLEQMVASLQSAIQHGCNVPTVIHLLKALAAVNRFDMVVMFWGNKEKKEFTTFLLELAEMGADYQTISQLQAAYGCT